MRIKRIFSTSRCRKLQPHNLRVHWRDLNYSIGGLCRTAICWLLFLKDTHGYYLGPPYCIHSGVQEIGDSWQLVPQTCAGYSEENLSNSLKAFISSFLLRAIGASLPMHFITTCSKKTSSIFQTCWSTSILNPICRTWTFLHGSITSKHLTKLKGISHHTHWYVPGSPSAKSVPKSVLRDSKASLGVKTEQ